MKAAVLTAHNAPLELAEVEPYPLLFGQALVRILASGICGAQLQEIRGEKGPPPPHMLGHEGVGIVEAVGHAVTRVKPGDKVVCHWRRAAGIESPFPRYVYHGPRGAQEMTSGLVTTFAEKAICSENRITPIPADTPDDLAALLGCGLSTALGTIERDAALRFGESVLIIGLGGLGVNLVRAAKLAHAGRITCTDVHESKRAVAESMGAAFECSCERQRVGDCGYDVVIETSGSPLAASHAMRRLAPSGRFVMVGQPRPGAEVPILDARHMFEGEGKSIKATQGGGFRPELDIPRYINLWKTGALRVDDIITHRLPLDQINDGIDLVRNGHASRVLIEMHPAARV